MIKSLIIIDDNNNDNSIDWFNHTLYQMTVNDLRMGGENIDKDADITIYIGEGVDNSDPDDIIIL